jgi:hypothetical protein
MQAHLATLCQQAEVRDDGTLDIFGAAPEWIAVDQLPWRGNLRFALVLQFEVVDDPSDLRVGITVVRGRDRVVVGQVDAAMMEQVRTAEVVEGAPPYLPFALDLNVEFTEEGQYGIVVTNRDGQRLAFIVFVVRTAR